MCHDLSVHDGTPLARPYAAPALHSQKALLAPCGQHSTFGCLQVNLANDHRYMPQIVSSAIVNAPPPEGVIKTLHLCSTAHKNVDKQTKVRMIRAVMIVIRTDMYASSHTF